MMMEKSSWCNEAAEALTGLISLEMLPLFRQWIEDGTAILWRITGDDWITWLITRVEMFPNGVRELVFDAIAGKNARQILEAMLKRAKALGIHQARFESHHPENIIARAMGGLGFKRVTTVFKVSL